MLIFAWILFERGHQTTVGLQCRQQIFSVLSLAISSEPFQNGRRYYSDMESLVGFPLILKYVTLNDPEWLFYVKFCFCACRSRERELY